MFVSVFVTLISCEFFFFYIFQSYRSGSYLVISVGQWRNDFRMVNWAIQLQLIKLKNRAIVLSQVSGL